MNKIHESAKDPVSGKIIFRVKPECANSFTEFLNSKGYKFDSDGDIHNLNIIGVGAVSCRPFLLDYSDQLRDDVCKWDMN